MDGAGMRSVNQINWYIIFTLGLNAVKMQSNCSARIYCPELNLRNIIEKKI